MSTDPQFDDVTGVEADTADVLDQAVPMGGDTVEGALASRDRIAVVDGVEDQQLEEDADEAAGGAGV